VVFDGDEIDEAATREQREAERARRADWDGPQDVRRVELGTNGRPLGPGLRVVGEVIACGECGTALCDADANWKTGARTRELPLQGSNVLIPDPKRLVDADVVLRQFACPGCLRLLDDEVVREGDPPVWDIRLSGGA
jgi:N-methylhydantoinase B